MEELRVHRDKCAMKLLIIIGCLLITGLLFSWFLVNGEPVSSTQVDKLELGMSMEEVKHLLGEPAWESKQQDVWKYLATSISWKAYVIKFKDGVVVEKYFDD